MKKYYTLYEKWTVDFRKILFCIGVLALGTLYNIEEPKAFAVAVIVQGISNVDNFWSYLESKHICVPLKIMITILILFSTVAPIFAFYTLVKSKDYFDLGVNSYAGYYILGSIFAVAFPIIPLIVDIVMNIKQESLKKVMRLKREENSEKLAGLDGGEENEL